MKKTRIFSPLPPKYLSYKSSCDQGLFSSLGAACALGSSWLLCCMPVSPSARDEGRRASVAASAAAAKATATKARLQGLQKFGSMSTINNAVARFDLSGRGVELSKHHLKWQVRVHNLIEEPKTSHLGAFIYMILMGLVLLSSVVLCLGTLPEFKDNDEIKSIEWACAIAFSVELILRIASWQDKWYTMLYSGTLYVDVLSVVPFFIVQGIEMSSTVDEVSSGMVGEEKDNGMQIIGILRSAPVEK